MQWLLGDFYAVGAAAAQQWWDGAAAGTPAQLPCCEHLANEVDGDDVAVRLRRARDAVPRARCPGGVRRARPVREHATWVVRHCLEGKQRRRRLLRPWLRFACVYSGKQEESQMEKKAADQQSKSSHQLGKELNPEFKARIASDKEQEETRNLQKGKLPFRSVSRPPVRGPPLPLALGTVGAAGRIKVAEEGGVAGAQQSSGDGSLGGAVGAAARGRKPGGPRPGGF